LFSKGSSNAINIITGIAATGVIIGAMSLFVVLSGFSGLKDFSLQFSSYFDPDLKVFPASGKLFAFSKTQQERLQKLDGIASFSQIVEERVFLEYRDKNKSAFIKGVDSNYTKIIQTDSILIQGTWLGKNDTQVIAGFGISNALNMGIDDYQNLLQIIVPRPGKGQVKDPSKAFNTARVVNVGIYNVNEDLDEKYVFAKLDMARKLLKIPEEKITHLELKLHPGANEEALVKKINKIFENTVVVKNTIQLNDTLYKMLNTENLAVYLIFTLVLIIALFNLVGSIIMMVIDKKQNIKTLYNLGASLQEIRHIFLLQGTLMTLLGGLLGLGLGLIIITLQQQTGLLMITPSLPYPTKITWGNVVVVFLTIFVLGGIASLLASSSINGKLVEG